MMQRQNILWACSKTTISNLHNRHTVKQALTIGRGLFCKQECQTHINQCIHIIIMPQKIQEH